MTELPKAYDFHDYEEKIYRDWESKGYFKPWNDPNELGFDPTIQPFVIVMPPPNITGTPPMARGRSRSSSAPWR